ncbi:MAG: BLUF domain-containing protein [Alphaproteobacteria bacterium]|nr:BLUF domain-containing protein [Alphaproteobacteria bacterium]
MPRQLIYTSRATRKMADAGLLDLLAVSRDRNAAAGVTGLLLYARGQFIQVLEGAPDAVQDIYSSIERDTRHRDLIVLRDKLIIDREFDDWAMGFVRSADDAPPPEGFSEFLESADKKSRPTSETLRLLRLFRDQALEQGCTL